MSDPGIVIMPFGKFKGKKLAQIPSDYLLWAAKEWKENESNKDLLKACSDEWKFRERNNCHFSELEPD